MTEEENSHYGVRGHPSCWQARRVVCSGKELKHMHKGLSNYCFEDPVIEEKLEGPEEELLPVENWLIFMQHTMSATMCEGIKKMYYDDRKPASADLEEENKGARYAMKQGRVIQEIAKHMKQVIRAKVHGLTFNDNTKKIR